MPINIRRRIGRFRVSGHIVNAALAGDDHFSHIFSKVFILRMNETNCDDFEYVGVSELFEELEEGEWMPMYLIESQFEEKYLVCETCDGKGSTGKLGDKNCWTCHECNGTGRKAIMLPITKAFREK